MQYQSAYAPIRTTSRSIVRKRARRALFAALGITFALGCASSLTPLDEFGSSSVIAQQEQPAATEATEIQLVQQPVPAEQVAQAMEAAPPETTAVQPVVLIKPQDKPTPAALQVAQTGSFATSTSIELTVGRGETLSDLLTETGLTQAEALHAERALGEVFELRQLAAGQRVALELEPAQNGDALALASLSMPVSLTTTVELSRSNENEFTAKKIEKPLERKLAFAGGKIRSSLYQTASDIGLPRGMVGEIINALSYDVDFQRDIKSGDTIEVLYERMENYEGKHAGTGDLIYAELNMGGESVRIYRYEDKSGFADFYNETGESVRKALLRTPISGARISSGYGMRNHPILGYNRMHRGVDFAAPIGTPIFAAGDGRVEFVGRKGGYGNYLKIAHNDKYATAYAHLSRFAGGIAPGKRVRQGQIVAYVGNTGSSTGPHLHYEVHVNGDQVNPSSVKFKTGNVLKGKELAAFKRSMEKIEAKLDAVKKGNNDIAMADFKREVYATN
ncbi:MAG: peptidoglycan DD-metalloendopeptidase family protein [Alphaproteobacteria bacterium]|nr:peptidoglycan DD-metalloendopeptidase family protein [Alphaproteobacteria bacterium]